MAALKKTLKKKDTTKPSTILIIFLVLFILTSIGLGVAMYYGYEGQEKLRQAAKDAKTGETVRKEERDYRITQAYMLAAALGQELDDVDKDLGGGNLENLSNEGGKFSKEKDRPAFAKLFEDMKKDLTYDAAAKKFATNYRAKNKQLDDELSATKAKLDTTQKALQAEQKKFTDYETKVENHFKDIRVQVGKNKDNILAATNQRSECRSRPCQERKRRAPRPPARHLTRHPPLGPPRWQSYPCRFRTPAALHQPWQRPWRPPRTHLRHLRRRRQRQRRQVRQSHRGGNPRDRRPILAVPHHVALRHQRRRGPLE